MLDLPTAALTFGTKLSLAAGAAMSATTPTPTPQPEFDESIVTPGPVGFLVIFGIAVITVLLILDMVRRIRRVRLRQELEAEALLARAAETDNDSAP